MLAAESKVIVSTEKYFMPNVGEQRKVPFRIVGLVSDEAFGEMRWSFSSAKVNGTCLIL